MRKPTNSKVFTEVLRTYCVPGSIPGVGEIAVNETERIAVLMELMTCMTGDRGSSQLTTTTDERH